jgi:hypothetical protein
MSRPINALLPLIVCAFFPLFASAYDGFVVLHADEAIAPFKNPIDLAGRSVTFTLQSDGTYAVANVPLQFDGEIGTLVPYEPGGRVARYTLGRFAFPFFGQSLSELTLARDGGIYPGTPPEPTVPRYDWLEAAVQHKEPVIAPLLMRSPSGAVTIHAKELDDRAVFTWTLAGAFPLRMQAVLFRNGDIVFSYDEVHPELTGAVIVSRGLAALPKHAIASFTDPADDTRTNASSSLAAALDLLSISFSRVADLDLLELRLTMKAPLVTSTIPDKHLVNWEIDLGGAKVKFDAAGDVTGTQMPVRGVAYPNTKAVSLEGNTLVVLIDEDYFGATGGPLPATIRTSVSNAPTPVDELTFSVTLGNAARTGEVDLSKAAGARHADIIVEAFTLPSLDPDAAWLQLKKLYGLTDADVDAVALYQNFDTNLRVFARAYSTVGNSGADGVWTNGASSSARPRSPALLHMNSLEHHGTLSTQTLLLHELGHRWLFWVDYMDGAVRSGALNAGGAHPGRHTNLPAVAATGPTPMNGERWNDNGDGTFTRVPGTVGYSWLELYLMGLASASEVAPVFHIENAVETSNRETVRGTRKNVSIEQIIAAMGPRFPAYPQAQKKFAMLFVLVVDRVPTAAEIQTMKTNSTSFPQTFRNATAQRGEIVLLDPTKPKRRAARH